jgi:hypothetical protein
MAEPNLKRAEFFAILIGICTVTAIIILVVDFQIKGAILDATNRYYKFRANENDGIGKARPNLPGHIDGRNDGGIPAYLVDNGNAGMEKAGNTSQPVPKARARNRSNSGGNSEVPSGDKSL